MFRLSVIYIIKKMLINFVNLVVNQILNLDHHQQHVNGFQGKFQLLSEEEIVFILLILVYEFVFFVVA